MTDTTIADHRAALVTALGVLGSGPEERFDRITRMAQDVFGVPMTFLNLVDDHMVHARSAQGFPDLVSVPKDDVFCSVTVQHAEPTIVPDTRLDPRFANLPVVKSDPGIRFYAGAPLTMVDGTRVGTICLMDPNPRQLGQTDVALLQDFARWAERELSQSIDQERLRKVLDGLVPDALDVPGYDLDGVSINHRDGGGDIVDWRQTEAGDIALTVGDVSTRGAAAALLAAGVRGALVARTSDTPDVAVRGLERQVGPELAAADSVASVFHARVVARSGRVDFVDAGHGLALHVRADGGVNELRSLDLPMGVHPSAVPRASGSILLRPGDRLVLVTDGVLTLPGLEDMRQIARAAAVDADGPTFVDRVREATIMSAPDADVTAVVLTKL
jgi:hypothetical protein